MRPAAYRAGIIGCGRIGCGFDDDPKRGYVSTHAGAYRQTAGVELVALSDVDPEKLERYGKKFEVAGRYTDHRRMLAQERLDIVSICTWVDTHRALVDDAVSAGVRAIFCEKPVAESLAGAGTMVERCREAGVLLMVNHQRRFDRFHRQVAEYLCSGQLGRIQHVTAYYTAGLANTGTHLLDLLRMFLGDVEWVQAIKSASPSPNPGDPNLDGWIQFRSGARAALQACDVKDYTIFEINLLGAGGRLRVMSHGFEAQLEEAQESRRFAGYRELIPAAAPVDAGGPREYMLQAVAHLVDCLEHGKKPLCTGEDGRAALELICALRQSADSGGQRVHLPLKENSIVIASR
jgi:predicted dehydrogenase